MPQQPITDMEGNIIGYAPAYEAPAPAAAQPAQATRNPWDSPMAVNPNANADVPANTPTASGSGSNYWKSGKDVGDLQTTLLSQGYELPNYGVDSKYGKETDAAYNKQQSDIDFAASTFGVNRDDVSYNSDAGRFEPKIGTKNTEYGDVWKGDKGWDDPGAGKYAYDEENDAWLSEEEYNNKDWGDNNTATNTEKTTDTTTTTTTESDDKKWYQKLGVNQNNILGIIEAATIIKANRVANAANKKIGDLTVNTKRAKPQSYNPELIDLSEAKRSAKELATAAIQHSQKSGRSTAETRSLLTAGSQAQKTIDVKEQEMQKQQRNIAQSKNIEERRNVEQYNITNERKDQIANNDSKASMYKNSIAITHNMRDAVLTKIKDYKLLASAEKQMRIIGDAIAGKTGLDDRKFDDSVDYLVGMGAIDKEQAITLKTNQVSLNKADSELAETKEGAKGEGFWARRKRLRQENKDAKNAALYLDDQGNEIMAE